MTAKDFILKLREQAGQIKKIIFFDSAFNLLIAFLAFFILLSLTGFIGFIYSAAAAVALSVITSIILFIQKTRNYDALRKISEKYPNFEESLKTAYDNRDKDNIIIRSLMKDASGEMDRIDTESFFNKKQIIFKVFLIIFLSFLLLLSTFLSESMAFNNLVEEGSGVGSGGDNGMGGQTPDENMTDDERNPFGNKTELKPQGDPVPLDVKSYAKPGAGNLQNPDSGNKGTVNYENISTSGERTEYKEDGIIKEDALLQEAIKEKYSRTNQTRQ